MPHHPRPFFRTARNAWFVQIGPKQINLGEDKDGAFSRYHELMAAAQRQQLPPDVEPVKLVAVVIDSFLDFVQQHRSPETYRWYKDRLQLFLNSIQPDLRLDQLKPFHVQKWIDSYPDLSSGTKRNYCRSIMRCLRWAEEQGYINRSPLAHFRKPPGGKKEQIVTTAEYQALLERTTDQQFQDLLTVTWETGCRPQESLRVEARHVDLAGERWFFPASEAKGKKLARVVYLTPKALEITKRLIGKHPTGPLFRNVDGKTWKTDAVNCRFCRIKKQKGVRYSLYAMRHTWINRMLLSGVDAFTVATLAGHSDPSMLAKHYAHLSQAPDFLCQQARRASA